MPRAGDRLGRYQLVRLLGRGGAGQVWEARLQGPAGYRWRVALKVLASGEPLRREARIGGLLRHPNLVDVYEVGESDGLWFLAMELCEGGTLASRAPLPPRAVVEVGVQVCDALAYAHRDLGLVHLDLKPENLLLHGPTVKVADLGIAVARGFTTRSAVRGTLGYMAPEQLAGRPEPRSDIYALGVVLRVLATGVWPAASETVSLDDDLSGAEPDPADGPDWLRPVLSRCLAPEPEDRFSTLAELAAALRALPAEGPSLADLVPAAAPDPAVEEVASAFVGRRAEIDDLDARLTPGALVTLKGLGGMGKTRLAREVAARRDAVFCDLSRARSLQDLGGAVGEALGRPLAAADEAALADQIVAALARRGAALVVLDNFEQVVAHAALVARCREAAPTTAWLVTSRAPLRAPGEQIVELGALAEADSVALIVERARARGVELSSDPRVEVLARRLDGIPLAVELAAGRLGVLDLGEVLERLDPSLLRSARDVADRHATLDAALAWSWDLLSPVEQVALAQLSVFRGSFEVAAAEAVVGLPPDSPWVLDVLGRLVDHSLLTAAGGRFHLLESVRAFASARLQDPLPVEVRHGEWFAAGPLRPDDLTDAIEAIRRSVARGDAALAVRAFPVASPVLLHRAPAVTTITLGRAVLAMPGLSDAAASRIGCLVGQALLVAGQRDEARVELERALPLAGVDPFLRGMANALLAMSARNEGRVEEALQRYELALEDHRAAGDRRLEATTLSNLARALQDLGRCAEAANRYSAALEAFRTLNHRHGQGATLVNLGILARETGEYDEARRCYEAALAIHRADGDLRSEGIALANLGLLEDGAGRPEAAEALLRRAIAVHREVGNLPSLGFALTTLGEILHDAGRIDEGTPLLLEGIALCRRVGNLHLIPASAREIAERLEPARG